MRTSKHKIENILKNWNIGKVKSIKQLSLGLVNYNWLVVSEKGKFVFRQVSKDKKIDELEFELNYLNLLKKKIPYKIPYPILDRKKRQYFKHEGDYYWLYNFIEGDIKEDWTKEDLKKIAIMVANYHKILGKSNLPTKKEKSEAYFRKMQLKESQENIKKIKNKKIRSNSDKVYLMAIEENLRILKSLDNSHYKKLKQYSLHRDMGPENILWENGVVTAIIDFDNIGLSSDVLLKDLSIVVQRSCSSDNGVLNLEKTKSFLREYNNHRNLTTEDIKLIINMIIGSYFEDFNYSYWLVLNDPKRSKVNWIKENSNALRRFYKDRDKIVKETTPYLGVGNIFD